MLPKSKRLTTEEIESLSTGKSVFGTLISMRVLKSGTTKFAVSVSKKIAPLAVDRNRMRRRVYSVIPALGDLKTPAFIMLMPKKELLAAPIEVVQSEVSAVLKKGGLI
jgi:ribonuclease P protein component